MLKRCIIFDNEDQSQEIEKMVRDGKKSFGIDLECVQFNVGSTFLDEVLSNGKIDTQKVVREFKRKFKKETFQLAAFDRDLSDPDIDGIELIRQLTHHKILKNTPKIIYSGLLEEILGESLDKNNKGELIQRIKTLVNNDIKGYFDRESYEADILRILSGNEETLDLIIEEELIKFPEFVFKNKFSNERFSGMSFAEISQILEEYDPIRNDFKKEIIQQVISYLTESVKNA